MCKWVGLGSISQIRPLERHEGIGQVEKVRAGGTEDEGSDDVGLRVCHVSWESYA